MALLGPLIGMGEGLEKEVGATAESVSRSQWSLLLLGTVAQAGQIVLGYELPRKQSFLCIVADC